MEKKTILTGIRPTGHLHIGHYFGASRNWVKLQDKFDTYIEIADVQALTDNFNNPDKVSLYDAVRPCRYVPCGQTTDGCLRCDLR